MTKIAIEKRWVTFTILLVIIYAGLTAYRTMSRAENPGFTIRTALVTTILPGASPQRVEDLVTDPIEAVIQQIPELDFISSESQTGVSIIYVNFKERYREMRPIFDNLRRKISDVRSELPAEAIGPEVNDEFGDVFGIIFTLTGEGFTYAELEDVADQVRDELLRVPDAAKVEIYGSQAERIFLEYDNVRLATLGLSPQQLQQALRAQNIIFPGGNIDTGEERITLEPSGNFATVAELGKAVITHPARGDVLYLEDIVNIRRGYVEPPGSLVHSSGVPALGIGVSMRDGGNIIHLGQQTRAVIQRMQQVYPIGIEFNTVCFQPAEVSKSVDNFISSLVQAIAIVVVLMLLFLGPRTGLVVASLIPAAMLASFALMLVFGISLNTISIAALIIALGLLVDNAIVMSESILVSLQRGMSPVTAAVSSAQELRVPLLTSSLTTSAAFLPIFLAESSTGEYTAHLFMVVTITLLCSWLLSLTLIPLLCVVFVRVKRTQLSDQDSPHQAYDSPFYRRYRNILLFILRWPAPSLAVVVLLFFGALQLGRFIPVLFFPASDRPLLRATLEFPVGTPIGVTTAMVEDLEQNFLKPLQVKNNRTDPPPGPGRSPDGENGVKRRDEPPGGQIVNWVSFIGVGSPRYTLSAQVDPQKEELAKLIINTTTRQAADEIQPLMESWLWERYPDLDAVILPLDYGPPVTSPVEIRISGDDPDALFTIVDETKLLLANTPGTKNVVDDWGRWVKKLLVNVDQPRARRAGVSSMDIAVSLQTILSGLEVTDFRESEDIIPVVMRTRAAHGQDIGKLETMDVFSQATGRPVPLKQVADLEVWWEPSVILRRDRLRTVTVSAQLENTVTAVEVVNQIDPQLAAAQVDWPLGTFYEYGGEIESSEQANQSIVVKLPIAFAIIVLLLVIQFNHIKGPVIIVLTIPLALIGVFVGLFLMHGIMGFMTFLGVISLAGIVINNAIVLLDRINIEITENGLSPRRAVVESAQKRLRPILLTTATTIGGLVPLYLGGGPMWESMAIAIMFGLAFATLLTLGVVPILYSLLNRVSFAGYVYSGGDAPLSREEKDNE